MNCKSCNKISFKRKVYNYLLALFKRIITGGHNVPDEVEMLRKVICYGCKHYDRKTTECSKCGCPTNQKVVWASESCPQGYWKTYKKPSK
tara:strand:- start:462 stop:731 length:270 start_codon:yes stop_codon:yes gene_type:complete